MEENISAARVACANPLIEELDGILTDSKLKRRLQFSPLAGIDVGKLGKEDRLQLLDRMQLELFVPSLSSIDFTTRLYRMIRKGYLPRNPTLASSKRTSMVISRLAGQELRGMPWLPTFAHGMRKIGITGLGKTYEVKRAIEQLPPRIEHGKCAAADWNHFYQAPYLYVGMSHDGSLGGLLLNILVALDTAIFTDYSSDRRLTLLSNEKLAVHVGIILSNHAVGVLIIDEIQEENFTDGARGDLARTFFLRLLNFGIPILMVGNPLGMQFLNSHSQDLRRLGSCGTIDLHPFEADDTNYQDCLAPAFWNYNVLSQPPDLGGQNSQLLYQYSGGIRDFACRIIVAAQRIAIELNKPRITPVYLEQAFLGPDFSNEERLIVRSFANKDALSLRQFKDIPWETYYKKWGTVPDGDKQEPDDHNGQVEAAPVENRPPPAFAKKTAENVSRQRTKRKNQQANVEQRQSELDESDMRVGGIKEALVAGLKTACAAER
jgi:hypothetical protein